jgi:tRNA(Ile)-lysidine synthase TilS/MesJ
VVIQSKSELILRKRLDAKFKKAVRQYGLIQENDRILVGLSGGKDSLALLELFVRLRKTWGVKFDLMAVHINIEDIPYQADVNYLKSFCESFDIPFLYRQSNFSNDENQHKSICFLCSWHRRKELFNISKELKCNKIALGHHLDDITQTLLMNLFYQGSFTTMPPILKTIKVDAAFIRPLTLIREYEIEKLSQLNKYQIIKTVCPFENESSRHTVKKMLSELEINHPDVHQNILNAMENVDPQYLPTKIPT